MGEVRVTVRLQGITRRGDLSAVGAGDFEALVDTGASKTIVSESVARRAGIRRLGITGGVAGVTGVVEVDVGMALAMAPRCRFEALMVGISDEVTRRAGVEVVLGHDYMQAVRMAVTPYNGRAKCSPARGAGAKTSVRPKVDKASNAPRRQDRGPSARPMPRITSVWSTLAVLRAVSLE